MAVIVDRNKQSEVFIIPRVISESRLLEDTNQNFSFLWLFCST